MQKKWREQDSLLDNDYMLVEPVYATRGALSRLCYDLSGRRQSARTLYMDTLEHIAKQAREASRHQVCSTLHVNSEYKCPLFLVGPTACTVVYFTGLVIADCREGHM